MTVSYVLMVLLVTMLVTSITLLYSYSLHICVSPLDGWVTIVIITAKLSNTLLFDLVAI